MRVDVNPEILVWARESAGFDAGEAAQKLGLHDSSLSSAKEKLEALEAGKQQPTQMQLATCARVYKRPLTAFYLAEPPKTGQRGQDFRQTPNARSPRENGMLDALLRDVKARQELLRDILLDEDDFKAPDFVGSATPGLGVGKLVQRVADTLGFDHTDVSQRKGDPQKLFARLRQAAEEAGVFVLVLGDLGHHTSAIGADVFRGFAIADPVAPFVVINAHDARPARAFTLIHELAHIWLGQTGVSGKISTALPKTETARVERFCNDVAGAFLLPDGQFTGAVDRFNPDDIEAACACIDHVARQWAVSEPMVAYRLYRTGALSAVAYQTLRDDYHQRWADKVKKEKARKKENEGGPSWHVTRHHSLGQALVDVVHCAFQDRNITYTAAARLLDMKASTVPRFFDFVENNGHHRPRALTVNTFSVQTEFCKVY
ncbi:MAG: ImmA/IrrE family metallo-endopeptidase [Rhodobacteraceae bacterium]|nr:ImmA/IrrE family metallo-endopeptidase [Paracoccaceae bacterium]